MDENSPLRFLNIDVSEYIYETYYPDKKAKENKQRMNEEFLQSVNKYKSIYHVDNIYNYEIVFCIRGSLYRKVYFLGYLNEYKYKTLKYKRNKEHLSYYRAIKYKNESLHLKKLINHVL